MTAIKYSDARSTTTTRFEWKTPSIVFQQEITDYFGEQRGSRRDGDHGEREQRGGAFREVAGDRGMHEASRRALPGKDLANYVVPECLPHPLHALDLGDLQIR